MRLSTLLCMFNFYLLFLNCHECFFNIIETFGNERYYGDEVLNIIPYLFDWDS